LLNSGDALALNTLNQSAVGGRQPRNGKPSSPK
jgi:hypothetical protein